MAATGNSCFWLADFQQIQKDQSHSTKVIAQKLSCLQTRWETHNIIQPYKDKSTISSIWHYSILTIGLLSVFSSPCQRQCELLPSIGVRRPLTFHILIFSSENP
jgi:hypothetical protein